MALQRKEMKDNMERNSKVIYEEEYNLFDNFFHTLFSRNYLHRFYIKKKFLGESLGVYIQKSQ